MSVYSIPFILQVHKTKGTMIVGTARPVPPTVSGVEAATALAAGLTYSEMEPELGTLSSPDAASMSSPITTMVTSTPVATATAVIVTSSTAPTIMTTGPIPATATVVSAATSTTGVPAILPSIMSTAGGAPSVPTGLIAVNGGPGGQTVLVNAADLSNYATQLQQQQLQQQLHQQQQQLAGATLLNDSGVDPEEGDEDDDEDDEDMMEDDEIMTTTSIGGTRRSVYVGSGLSVTNPVMAVGIPSIGPDGESVIEYEEGTIGPGGAPVSKHNPLGKKMICDLLRVCIHTDNHLVSRMVPSSFYSVSF